MIISDIELEATQERIAFFYRILAQMRTAARSPEDYRLYSNSYLAEIENMNAEVLDYLKQPADQVQSAEAA